MDSRGSCFRDFVAFDPTSESWGLSQESAAQETRDLGFDVVWRRGGSHLQIGAVEGHDELVLRRRFRSRGNI